MIDDKDQIEETPNDANPTESTTPEAPATAVNESQISDDDLDDAAGGRITYF